MSDLWPEFCAECSNHFPPGQVCYRCRPSNPSLRGAMFAKFLTYLQKLVAADKAPLIAAALAGIGLLAAKFGFKMNASDVSYLGVLLTFLAGAFTHAHFAAKPKP